MAPYADGRFIEILLLVDAILSFCCCLSFALNDNMKTAADVVKGGKCDLGR